jgi:hypothetical protein
MIENNEEETMDDILQSMYENYIEGGFDFATSDTFDEVFRRIFFAGAQAVIDMIEDEEQ